MLTQPTLKTVKHIYSTVLFIQQTLLVCWFTHLDFTYLEKNYCGNPDAQWIRSLTHYSHSCIGVWGNGHLYAVIKSPYLESDITQGCIRHKHLIKLSTTTGQDWPTPLSSYQVPVPQLLHFSYKYCHPHVHVTTEVETFWGVDIIQDIPTIKHKVLVHNVLIPLSFFCVPL